MPPPPLPALSDRSAGVLLHVTSLPGRHGSGDLGPEAHAFIDWAARAGLRWWQTLPVNPGHSPYSAQSAFAGNPMLVSPEPLVERGLLSRADAPARPAGRIDFATTAAARDRMLRAAFAAYSTLPRRARAALEAFAAAERRWLDDWALFAALRRAHGDVPWWRWPPALRARRRGALAAARRAYADEIAFHVFTQWRFDEQWRALRARAAERGVALLGDVPFFVAHDSADVWAHPELFRLDDAGLPTHVAGVPPDYFSVTGQRWGNPLYRWPRHRATGYAWWIDRLASTLRRFDAARLDHFIGFHHAWEIPAADPSAAGGRWLPSHGAALLTALRRKLGGALPFVAEDLGAVTPEVRALRDRFGLPGMKPLQFAFGPDPSTREYLPHNHPRHALVTSGTHDNDTTRGWWDALSEPERQKARAYLGSDGGDMPWALIRAIFMSVANLAIVPMQDFLGLGSEARMNVPATASGNWEWRLADGATTDDLAARIAELVVLYGRGWET